MYNMSGLFKLVGGKGNKKINSWILSYFPPHQLYIEPFIGGGSIFYNKDKAPKSIINDINPDFVAAHTYISSLSPKELKKIQNTKFNEETFQNALERLENPKCTQRGYYTLIRQRMSRGGLGRTFSKSDRLRGGQIEGQNSWDNWAANLDKYKDKLVGTTVCNSDFSEVFDFYGHAMDENCLIYVDPPYLDETRTSNLYEYEFDRKDHVILAAYLLNTKAKVLLSGYDSELYRQIYKDWNCERLEVANHSGQNFKKQRRIECLWKNY